MKPYALAALLLTSSALTSAALSQPAADAPLARIVVKPSAMTEAGGGSIEVMEAFGAIDIAAGQPLLSIDNHAPGMTRPQGMEGLTVTDAAGVVPLTADKAEAPTSWTAGRAVKGEMVVRYRLPVANDDKATGGPPINIRVDGRSVSTVGGMLLAMPATKAPYRVSLTWDLSDMGAGAGAVSTFGDGDVTLGAGPLQRIYQAFYVIGPVKREPDPPQGSFQAVWGGTPHFDPAPAVRWAQNMHHWMSNFFGDPQEPPYRVFLRYNPAANAGGGAAYPRSFLWTYGEGVSAEHMEAILGHEMTHTWTAAGVGKWFSEGNAVYYQQRLPWRAGVLSTAAYVDDINKTAARYYTNELSHSTDAQVMADYWSDVRFIVIPYDRGAIYFAVLDGKIRKASGGKRSIDDLIREVVDRNRREVPTTEANWIEMVRQELGDEGLTIHKAMMAGETMVPDSDAYGPCLRRKRAKIRRYDLGYHQFAAARENVVRYLKPGSEAAKAGIREGDRIVLRTNTDGHQRDPDMKLTVQITRDGKTFPVTYLPRGEAVDGWRWEQIPGADDAACRA